MYPAATVNRVTVISELRTVCTAVTVSLSSMHICRVQTCLHLAIVVGTLVIPKKVASKLYSHIW